MKRMLIAVSGIALILFGMSLLPCAVTSAQGTPPA